MTKTTFDDFSGDEMNRVSKVFKEVAYKDWALHFDIDEQSGPYIMWVFYAPDYGTVDNKITRMETRRWNINLSDTETKLVRTAWKAVQNAELHEAAETFKYKERSVYSPHININALVDIASHQENFDMES